MARQQRKAARCVPAQGATPQRFRYHGLVPNGDTSRQSRKGASVVDETLEPNYGNDPPTSAIAHVVVGIGASAGGVEALRHLFSKLSARSGMAFVVVLHLPPEHESQLAQVLQAVTVIPVTQVRGRIRVEPDHAYVVSPNHTVWMRDGEIHVAPLQDVTERKAPVDIFFRTLAEAQGMRAVCIVLSGTGANGSMGLKLVKERGGLCIAQEPKEAEFGDMPRNAIATGLVDHVLSVSEMPKRLEAYRARLDASGFLEQKYSDTQDRALIEIFALLRLRTGHDFANYKRSTVLRRIERRLNLTETRSLEDYAHNLRSRPEEAEALLRDLLISVTTFFRDPQAWKALEEQVIPKIFHGKGAGDHVRVWVAGCATGEEAYSMAMLLSERITDPRGAPTLQVFATDIDAEALAKARAGLYSEADTVEVSPERLRRFFAKDGDAYRVRRELRELVLFAPHNVLKDPPFSHLDLISCRNLFIYLNRAAQERIQRLFHFGLHPGGYLFLGSSEFPDEATHLYVALDKVHHIFETRSPESASPLPPLVPFGPPLPRPIEGERDADLRIRERLSYQDLHQRLLELYAPPSLIVDQDYDILHLSAHAGSYLQFGGGEPSRNLLKVVRPELRLELHSALHHAVQSRQRTEALAGPLEVEGRNQRVKLVVNPVLREQEASRGLILVVFQPDSQPSETAPQEAAAESVPPPSVVQRLEEELMQGKLQQRATIEQHELQQEELKASNEELQAMNEELRSSSEELETSKEELQSLNEELTTVNQELKHMIDELSEANNDTMNLIHSTDVATLFIDRTMRIKLFTPRAKSLFNLIASDTGRPLLDITHRLNYPQLGEDIQRVLDTLHAHEREVLSADGRGYIVRILPYRTTDDRIAGVVVTFTDISERRSMEAALRASEERLRLVVECVPDYAIVTIDPEGRIESWNSAAHRMFGYGVEEMIGRAISSLFTKEDVRAGVVEQGLRDAAKTGRAEDERWHVRKDGSALYVSGVTAPLHVDGKLVGFTRIARDVTDRVKSERELRSAHAQLESQMDDRNRDLADANAMLRREIDDRIKSEEMRLRLLRQLVQAQEDERRRISRELHDQLGQEITALGLKLSALKVSPHRDSSLRSEIEDAEQMVKRLDNDVDFLVWELRPTALDDMGLKDGLADYIERWSQNFGIPVRFQPDYEGRLPTEIETVLYRIAQEALNNVAKHAQATEATVNLERGPAHVSLTIHDNGKGFDANASRGARAFGLQGMRERVGLVGGAMAIQSQPGGGTSVGIRVPL